MAVICSVGAWSLQDTMRLRSSQDPRVHATPKPISFAALSFDLKRVLQKQLLVGRFGTITSIPGSRFRAPGKHYGGVRQGLF